MNLIIQISNSRVIEKLHDFGKVLYEVKSLDAVVLEVSDKNDVKSIERLPGVLSLKEEMEGCLMV